MAVLLPDSTCIVARLCGWHSDNAATAQELDRRLDADDDMIVAAPALVEAYSVLTRLPAPRRLPPAVAIEMLRQSFVAGTRVVALSDADYLGLLERASERSVLGGQIYPVGDQQGVEPEALDPANCLDPLSARGRSLEEGSPRHEAEAKRAGGHGYRPV